MTSTVTGTAVRAVNVIFFSKENSGITRSSIKSNHCNKGRYAHFLGPRPAAIVEVVLLWNPVSGNISTTS